MYAAGVLAKTSGPREAWKCNFKEIIKYRSTDQLNQPKTTGSERSYISNNNTVTFLPVKIFSYLYYNSKGFCSCAGVKLN